MSMKDSLLIFTPEIHPDKTKNVTVHRRVAEDAKRMNIFLSAERAERKKLSF